MPGAQARVGASQAKRLVAFAWIAIATATGCDPFAALETSGGDEECAAPEPDGPSVAGAYHVVALRSQTSCGDGLLATPAVWEFDVILTRRGNELRWAFTTNQSAEAVGAFAGDDASFQVVAQSRFDLSSETCCNHCFVLRRDEVAGRLEAEERADGPELHGFLRYAFSAEAGSNCTTYEAADVDPDGSSIVPLPCEISYELTGEAISAESESEQ